MASSNMIYTLSDWQIGTLRGYFSYAYHPCKELRVIIERIAVTDTGYLIVEYIQNGKMEVHKIPREPNQTPVDWNFNPEINPYE